MGREILRLADRLDALFQGTVPSVQYKGSLALVSIVGQDADIYHGQIELAHNRGVLSGKMVKPAGELAIEQFVLPSEVTVLRSYLWFPTESLADGKAKIGIIRLGTRAPNQDRLKWWYDCAYTDLREQIAQQNGAVMLSGSFPVGNRAAIRAYWLSKVTM